MTGDRIAEVARSAFCETLRDMRLSDLDPALGDKELWDAVGRAIEAEMEKEEARKWKPVI